MLPEGENTHTHILCNFAAGIALYRTPPPRYWLLRGCPTLVDWYARLLHAVADFSYRWPHPAPDSFLAPRGGDPERAPQDFNRSLRQTLEALALPQKGGVDDERLDTWVCAPSTQRCGSWHADLPER